VLLRLWGDICSLAWLWSVVCLGCATYCGAIRSAAPALSRSDRPRLAAPEAGTSVHAFLWPRRCSLLICYHWPVRITSFISIKLGNYHSHIREDNGKHSVPAREINLIAYAPEFISSAYRVLNPRWYHPTNPGTYWHSRQASSHVTCLLRSSVQPWHLPCETVKGRTSSELQHQWFQVTLVQPSWHHATVLLAEYVVWTFVLTANMTFWLHCMC